MDCNLRNVFFLQKCTSVTHKSFFFFFRLSLGRPLFLLIRRIFGGYSEGSLGGSIVVRCAGHFDLGFIVICFVGSRVGCIVGGCFGGCVVTRCVGHFVIGVVVYFDGSCDGCLEGCCDGFFVGHFVVKCLVYYFLVRIPGSFLISRLVCIPGSFLISRLLFGFFQLFCDCIRRFHCDASHHLRYRLVRVCFVETFFVGIPGSFLISRLLFVGISGCFLGSRLIFYLLVFVF